MYEIVHWHRRTVACKGNGLSVTAVLLSSNLLCGVLYGEGICFEMSTLSGCGQPSYAFRFMFSAVRIPDS